MPALDVYAGEHALAHIRENGLKPSDVRVIMGASGGPKWFVLTHLDRYLVSEWLPNTTGQIELVGSSIGAWRMSAYAHESPLAAIEALEHGYLNQRYSDRATAREVTEKLHLMLNSFIDLSDHHNHSRFKLSIVAARTKGLTQFEQRMLQTLVFAGVAASNAVSRTSLTRWFERVVFQSTGANLPVQAWDQFTTHLAPLNPTNMRSALHASGAIPVVIEGVRNPSGAPLGMYRDGGMVDYHFDLPIKPANGLVLYPHFAPVLKPGWFDKPLPWRKVAPENYSHTVVVCPSREFINQLPHGKIPDRKDFTRFPADERIAIWQQVIDRNQQLADDFHQLTSTDRIKLTAKPISELIATA